PAGLSPGVALRTRPPAAVHDRGADRGREPCGGHRGLAPGGGEGGGARPVAARAGSGMSRAGFVAVIGAPNAGKSTLVNRMVGTKVSIVTQKVQTTRFPVRGVAIEGESQMVLVDTPGIFTPRRR